MNEHHSTTLVLGATGKIGTFVAARLIKRDVARKNAAAWREAAT
jgi:uncharacterized protein YbjT (DUF2867 family)